MLGRSLVLQLGLSSWHRALVLFEVRLLLHEGPELLQQSRPILELPAGLELRSRAPPAMIVPENSLRRTRERHFPRVPALIP
jgi:hypothetical protein